MYRVLTKAYSNYSPISKNLTYKSIAEKMRPEEKARVSNILKSMFFGIYIISYKK